MAANMLTLHVSGMLGKIGSRMFLSPHQVHQTDMFVWGDSLKVEMATATVDLVARERRLHFMLSQGQQ